MNCIACKNKNQSILCCCCCFKLSDDISKRGHKLSWVRECVCWYDIAIVSLLFSKRLTVYTKWQVNIFVFLFFFFCIFCHSYRCSCFCLFAYIICGRCAFWLFSILCVFVKEKKKRIFSCVLLILLSFFKSRENFSFI